MFLARNPMHACFHKLGVPFVGVLMMNKSPTILSLIRPMLVRNSYRPLQWTLVPETLENGSPGSTLNLDGARNCARDNADCDGLSALRWGVSSPKAPSMRMMPTLGPTVYFWAIWRFVVVGWRAVPLRSLVEGFFRTHGAIRWMP